MTANDLHLAFKIELDKSSNSSAYSSLPGFIPSEIDYWLNKSVTQLVNNKLTGTNQLQQPFEVSVKRIADLQRLVKTDKDLSLAIPIQNATDWFKHHNNVILTDFTNKAAATGPFSRMYFVEATLNIYTGTGVGKQLVSTYAVNNMNHELAKSFIKTKYNSPYMTEPIALLQDNSLDILLSYEMCIPGNTFTLDLTFIKVPEKITFGNVTELTDFPEYVYSEIVSNAVLLALENIESKRVELKHQLNNTLE